MNIEFTTVDDELVAFDYNSGSVIPITSFGCTHFAEVQLKVEGEQK